MRSTTTDIVHRTAEELDAGLTEVRRSPTDDGVIEMLVARPRVDERQVLDVGELTVEEGLVGDDWLVRGSRRTPDGRAQPEAQLTLVNVRWLDLIAGSRERWPLAGDQLVVDLDLGTDNLAPGNRLQVGSAVIEITTKPHTGCVKYASRYGKDALKHTATSEGRELRLRGIYARVIVAGEVRPGDRLTRLPTPA